MPVVVDPCLSGMGGLDSGRVELRHLRVFEAVARLKSFTQAADELTITQPALSRTIQQLEDALGVTLLDRSSRHVEATPAGRMFLDHSEHSPWIELVVARPMDAGHCRFIRAGHRHHGQLDSHRRCAGRSTAGKSRCRRGAWACHVDRGAGRASVQ
jgi:hypothetical protein